MALLAGVMHQRMAFSTSTFTTCGHRRFMDNTSSTSVRSRQLVRARVRQSRQMQKTLVMRVVVQANRQRYMRDRTIHAALRNLSKEMFCMRQNNVAKCVATIMPTQSRNVAVRTHIKIAY